MKTVAFAWALKRGVCRWCRCTETTPCQPDGCAWADGTHTLCTACVPLERRMRDADGRRQLAEVMQGVRGIRDDS